MLFYTDGHHKLVRWRFVTHCAIDGYSRLVLFLKCSNNNRASTVYDSFLQSVQQYGLPSKVRCDQGGENMLVAHHMIHHRGSERRSVLVGSSVHNQRIERLWRNMHRCVTSLFYRLFYFLEHHGHLDPISDTHLYALHYVYLPRVNRALQQFHQAWKHHGVRTEGGRTPNQLFTAGSLRLRNSGLAALDFFNNVADDYGTDEDGIANPDNEGVEIPPSEVQLTEEQVNELQQIVNPLTDCDDMGVDLYLQTLEFVQSVI